MDRCWKICLGLVVNNCNRRLWEYGVVVSLLVRILPVVWREVGLLRIIGGQAGQVLSEATEMGLSTLTNMNERTCTV